MEKLDKFKISKIDKISEYNNNDNIYDTLDNNIVDSSNYSDESYNDHIVHDSFNDLAYNKQLNNQPNNNFAIYNNFPNNN